MRSESAHVINVRLFHPHTHRKTSGGEGEGGGKEGREGRTGERKGQYAGKHLHGIETMSRFQVARGQFFRGLVLKHLGSVDVQSQHP